MRCWSASFLVCRWGDALAQLGTGAVTPEKLSTWFARWMHNGLLAHNRTNCRSGSPPDPRQINGETIMFVLNLLLLWPRRIAQYFLWAGPLVARIVVGYTFMLTGWEKLQNLPAVTKHFARMGHPVPRFS